jgi:hypothetical protein
MHSNKTTARIAGWFYLGVVLTGIFSLAYMPSKLIDWNNPAITLQQIRSNEWLFRLSIVSGLMCYVFFLFLPLALFKLLKQVNRQYALLMVLLAVVSVPISMINMWNKFAVLTLINNSMASQPVSNDLLQNQVLFYLNQYENGNLIAQIFWGLWLFPFGYLVFKSGFLPKILGVLLMLGCFSYLVNFLGTCLVTDYGKLGIGGYISIPASLGEIGTCLWLLIIGAKNSPSAKTGSIAISD